MLSDKIKNQIKEGLDKVSIELLQRRFDRLFDVRGNRQVAIKDLEKEFKIKDIKFDSKEQNKIIDFKLLDYSPDPLLMGEDTADSKTVYALIDLLKKFSKQIKINLFDEYFIKIDALNNIITLKNVDNGKKISVEILNTEKNKTEDSFDIVDPMFVKKVLDELDKVKTNPEKM